MEQLADAKTIEILVILISPILLSCIFVIPLFGAILVLGFAFINPSLLSPIIEIEELSIRYVDVFFVTLIISVLLRFSINRRLIVSRYFKDIFTPIIFFMVYLFVSVVWISLSDVSSAMTSLASLLRLFSMMVFALLVYLSIDNERDLNIVHVSFITLCVFSVSISIILPLLVFDSVTIDFGSRFGGLLGVNSLGLASGLLILYSCVMRGGLVVPFLRLFLIIFGIIGIFLAKSASSTFATAIVVTIYYTTINPRKLRVLGVYRYVIVGGVVILSAIIGILSWRQSDIQGLEDLSSGSFSQRMIIAYAGLRVFLDHPLIGIGWQVSSIQNVYGSIEVSKILMDKFLDLGIAEYFAVGATSFHNMYIQFLAELGLLGSLLFIYVCFHVRYIIRRSIKDLPHGSPHLDMLYFYALGLIFLLIWWNTNALFGGQIETVLAFMFLSMESTIMRIIRKQINYDD